MRTSETVSELAEALAKAQGMFGVLKKDTPGQVGNQKMVYADLASVVEATRTGLSTNGLSVIQSPASDGATVEVTTRLLHSSGEWVESVLRLPCGPTPQTMGSSITYGRRYSLMALLGVAPDDDDGRAVSEAVRRPEASKGPSPEKEFLDRCRSLVGSQPGDAIAEAMRALSEVEKKPLTVKALHDDPGWFRDLVELVDAWTQ